MAFGGVPLWADGRLTLRVRGPGFGTGRPLTIPRPFALLGRGEGADICIDDPTVSTRHAYLHMDRRGIFVVDLATRTGLRFDDVAGSAGWLRPGQAWKWPDGGSRSSRRRSMACRRSWGRFRAASWPIPPIRPWSA